MGGRVKNVNELLSVMSTSGSARVSKHVAACHVVAVDGDGVVFDPLREQGGKLSDYASINWIAGMTPMETCDASC